MLNLQPLRIDFDNKLTLDEMLWKRYTNRQFGIEIYQ